jgi:HK97 family phage major capsid protein
MSDMSGAGLAQLVEEIKLASANIRSADDETRRQIRAVEESVNDLYRKVGRPGGFRDDCDTDERKSAIGLCQIRKAMVAEGDATAADYTPGSTEIQTAMRARQGLKALMRTGNVDRIEPEFRKALSAFSFGTNQFMMAPEMSNQVLSCLVDPSDLSGLVNQVTISAGSIKFLIDNARMGLGAWACAKCGVVIMVRSVVSIGRLGSARCACPSAQRNRKRRRDRARGSETEYRNGRDGFAVDF